MAYFTHPMFTTPMYYCTFLYLQEVYQRGFNQKISADNSIITISVLSLMMLGGDISIIEYYLSAIADNINICYSSDL